MSDITDGKSKWGRLNHLQLGKYAEYLAKMEFVLCGCDVFTSEVDSHGIDFVVRTSRGLHFDVQVKSFRTKVGATPYVFLQKSKFKIHPSSLLVLVKFTGDESPTMFLIQSQVGAEHNPLFESRDYGAEKKSPPEWGLTLSKKKLDMLCKDWHFHTVVGRLLAPTDLAEGV